MTLDLENKASKWAHRLGPLPGVRAIFLSGSLATGDAKTTSDIDIFIIAKSGQIWTARFFIFVVLKIFNQLAKPHHHDSMICPNHFITEEALEIQEQDAYAAHLFSQNIPLYDPQNIYSQFMAVNNGWFEKFGYILPTKFELKKPGSRSSSNSKSLEKFLKRIQIKRIKNNPEYTPARLKNKHMGKELHTRKRANCPPNSLKAKSDGCQIPGAKIILTDTELRFHPEPKNEKFNSKTIY